MKSVPFYIARRYLLAKKDSQAVSFVTWLAVCAMTVAVAAMFIVISVFSGLEDINNEMVANIHADISIKSAKGKTLPDINNVLNILRQNPEVQHYSKVIEEKVYIDYKNVGEIAYLRAVDSAYIQVNPIHKSVFYGSYPSFKFSNEGIIENQLDNRLSLPVGGNNPTAAIIYVPKPGIGIINKEEDIFNKKELIFTGVFSSTDQLNNYIITPLEFGQQLLSLPKSSVYQIVVKLKSSINAPQIKKELEGKLGKDYVIKTKAEENAAFWKVINTEKLMIYLIFALVIFITTFNLAGAIIILQLDKKLQAKSLISLGFSKKNLHKTYFYTGFLIVIFGVILGLMVGSVICYIQIETGIFKATETIPFPVRIKIINYLAVSVMALVFGLLVSWFSAGTKKLNFS